MEKKMSEFKDIFNLFRKEEKPQNGFKSCLKYYRINIFNKKIICLNSFKKTFLL